MMKIHTTQNLNSIRDNYSTNNIMPKEIAYNYLDKGRMSRLCKQPDTYESSMMSFRGKKEIVTRSADLAKRAVGKENRFTKWINKTIDKVLDRGSFDKTLDLMSHEVFVQAAISCLICVVARPLTIMGMALASRSGDKDDYAYAAGHSVSSGFAGLISSIIISIPFSKGAKHLRDNMIQELDEKILKRMYPNLNIESIWKDSSKIERKPIAEWIDTQGNQFSKEFKNVMKVARPKYIEDVSEKTLKEFGNDVDVNAMQGKSVNEWTDRNGKKLHFELKDMFIKVSDGELGANYFSLKHIDENFLKEVFPNLNISSISKDGERLHTDFWKNVDGSDFKLDMDTVQLSTYRETVRAVPLYTGRTRVETSGSKAVKYTSYQNNNGESHKLGVPDKLGSEIKQEWLDQDRVQDIKFKLLTWFPDIITRPFVAAGTIALLPIVLKNVFHLEKHKKKPEANAKEVKMESVKPEEVKTSGKAVA